MASKSIFMHFAIYFILQGYSVSEMVPEIAYNLEVTETLWSVFPINQIRGGRESYDIFVLIEGLPARIAVYNTTTYNVNSIRINTNRGKPVPTGPIKCELGNASKCYVQTKEISMSRNGWWEITFNRTDVNNRHIVKYLKVRVRPSKGPSISIGYEQWTTHIANYRIKTFDAFGCLVYNDDLSVNIKYQLFMALPESIARNKDGDKSIISFKGSKVCYTNNSTVEHGKKFIDCIQAYNYEDDLTMYEDWLTVRTFFIHSGNKSVVIDSQLYNVKPTSNDDEEGCKKYVNCLYDPDVIKQRDKYCVNTIPTVNKISVSTIVIVTVAAVAGIVGVIVLKLCVRRKNKKGETRNKDSTLNSVSYSHTSRQNLNTQSNHSDHIYSYIDVNSVQHPKAVPNLRIKPPAPPPRAERRRNDEKSVDHSNKHVETGPRCNLGEISAEQSYPNGVDEAEDAYSYAYADRFDILSALRSQEEAR